MSQRISGRANTSAAAVIVAVAVACAGFAFGASPAGAVPPSNDLIENATVIGALPFSTSQSTVDSTRSADDPPASCAPGSFPTVWYRYTASATQVLRVTASTQSGQVALVTYQGTPGALTQVACALSGPQLVSVTVGQTYYFMGAAASSLSLTVQERTPPPNDLIENAAVIGSLPYSTSQNMQDATPSATDPPASCIGSSFPNVWYRFDATASQLLRFTTSAQFGSAGLVTYQGAPGTLTQVACGLSGSQLVSVTEGQTYYLMGATSAPSLTLSVQVATPPANDLIENATVIGSLPFSASQSTQDATRSPADPTASCVGNSSSNVWYRFDATASQILRVTATASPGGVSLAIYQGVPGSLTQVSCGGGLPQLVSVTAGQAYYFMGVPTLGSSLNLAVQVATPPPNDLIENATIVGSLPFNASQSTQDATRSGNDPPASCNSGLSGTVWYRLDASASQLLRVTATSTPTGSATLVTYRGAPGALNEVACGLSEPQLVSVSAGQTYYFMVVQSLVGSVTLSVEVANPPANDLIANATPIGALPFTASQTTLDATRSPGDPFPSCIGGPSAANVWFRYEAPATQLLRLTPTSNAFTLGVVVFRGSPGAFAQVACGVSGSQLVTVTGGATYYIAVVTFQPVNLTFRVDLVDTAPTLTLPSDITVPATGPYGAVVDFTATASDGANPAPPVSCTPPAGSAFPVGDTVVSCTATDSSGLTARGSFSVHVVDTTPPELTLPSTVVVDATGPDGATVGYEVGATDNADPDPVVACTPTAGSVFGVGDAIVHCQATDAAGNSSEGTFIVHVKGAAEQLDALNQSVASIPNPGPRIALGVMSKGVSLALGSGNTNLACARLGVFITEVRATSARLLDPSSAQVLIDTATRVRSVLACNQ